MSRINHQERMFGIINQWEESGKTKLAFCIDSSIGINKFRYWLNKYDLSKKDNIGEFVRIKKDTNHKRGEVADIIFPNGVRVLLSQDCSQNWIRKIINCW